jgi:hypothetical protein
MQINLTNEEAAGLLARVDRAIAVDRSLRPKIPVAALLAKGSATGELPTFASLTVNG